MHLEHLLARVLGGFFDGGGNFIGLAVTDPDVAFAITRDDQRTEAERATAFDDLGATVDSDDGGFDAAFITAATIIAATATPSTATLPAATTSALSAATSTATATTAAALLRLFGATVSGRRGCRSSGFG
jgi:hypothetical protein